MELFKYILLGFLVICAVSVSLSKNLLNSILIYMSYSLIMSIIWILLESPDLAITEAAVGAGITTVLFFVTLKKIHAMMDDEEEADETNDEAQISEETDRTNDKAQNLEMTDGLNEKLQTPGAAVNTECGEAN